jgi:hypothetical protein
MGRIAILPLLAAVPLLVLPAGAQQTMGQTGATQMHSGTGRPNSGQFNAGRFNPFRPNAYGSNSGVAPPPPSWELPRVSPPHWEIPSYIPVQPNPVQGNPVSHRHGARSVGLVGVPYYVDPFAFADTSMYDDTAQQQQPAQQPRPEYAPQQNSSQQNYGPEEYPAARPPYNPEAYGAAAPPNTGAGNGAADDGLDHPEVTLVFNNGRPPLKVHSYVLTGTSVFVAEHGHERVIPVSELDLPATVEQNREAGVEFVLPHTTK